MTINELRIEAEKLGYTLTKKIVYVKLKPCKCGYNRPTQEITINPKGSYFYCPKCGLKTQIGKHNYQARENWNKAVENNDE